MVASCLKNCYNAVGRIAMPLLGTFYDAINDRFVAITYGLLGPIFFLASLST